jgi:hypothetical protein
VERRAEHVSCRSFVQGAPASGSVHAVRASVRPVRRSCTRRSVAPAASGVDDVLTRSVQRDRPLVVAMSTGREHAPGCKIVIAGTRERLVEHPTDDADPGMSHSSRIGGGAPYYARAERRGA